MDVCGIRVQSSDSIFKKFNQIIVHFNCVILNHKLRGQLIAYIDLSLKDFSLVK